MDRRKFLIYLVTPLIVTILVVSPIAAPLVAAQSISWYIYPQKWTRLQGNSASYYIAVRSQHRSISLRIQGLPQGASARFDPSSGNSLFGTFLSNLSISTTSTTPTGTHSLTVIVTGDQIQSQTTTTLKLVPNTADGARLVLYDAYAKYLSGIFWTKGAAFALASFSSDFGSSFTNPFSLLKTFAAGIVAPALLQAEQLLKQVFTGVSFLSASGMGTILGFTAPGVPMAGEEIGPLVEIASLIERGDRASASSRIRAFLSTLHTWLVQIEKYQLDGGRVTERIKQAAGDLVLSCINFLQYESERLGASTLRVISPNDGQIWRGGSTQSIGWTSVGVTGNVRIDISRDGGSYWTTLIANTPNDGSEPWVVTGPTTTRARIRVVSMADQTVWDWSDRTFIIDATSPSIRIISPNGGDVWRPLSTQTITWSASDDIGVTRIDIFYSIDAGRSWRTIATNLKNTGSYKWLVPYAPSANCLVRIDAYDAARNQASDTSDRPFTISGLF